MKLLLTVIATILFPVLLHAQQPPYVYDLIAGPQNSWPAPPVAYKNKLVTYVKFPGDTINYLTFIDIATGNVKVDTFVSNSKLRSCIVMNGDLYFVGLNVAKAAFGIYSEFWKYDDNGKHKQLTSQSRGLGSTIENLTVLNNKIYFGGYGLLNMSVYPVIETGKMFVCDPTKQNADMCIPSSSSIPQLKEITAFKNKIYFTGSHTTVTGNEVWCYNPATGVTDVLADLNPGTKNSWPYGLKVIGDKLYFVATTDANGYELYEYDGTNPVQRVTDINPGKGAGVEGSFTSYNNSIYLGANDGKTKGMYKYDATTKNVKLVYSSPDFAGLSMIQAHDGKLFFNAADLSFNYKPWKYDGVNTPEMIADKVFGGPIIGTVSASISYNGNFFFSAVSSAHGYEIYRYAEPTTGIPNQSQVSVNVTVYPNPTREKVYFKLETNEPVNICISDITGRSVYRTHKTEGTQTIEVPADNFASGTYYYSVLSTEGALLNVGKLVKE
jgi:ELWxxDGT repeat protein